jgi:hypothetical protein
MWWRRMPFGAWCALRFPWNIRYHRVTSVRRTLATVLLSNYYYFEQRGAPEALIFIHLIGSVQRVLHIPEIVKIGR